MENDPNAEKKEEIKFGFFKRIKNFFFSGESYSVRYFKFGLLFTIIIFILSIVLIFSVVGMFFVEYVTEMLFIPISNNLFGYNFTDDIGGFFSFTVPSILGWGYLCVIFSGAGFLIGTILDIFNGKRALHQIVTITLGVIFFGYLGVFLTAGQYQKCKLMLFDVGGQYSRGSCIVDYVIDKPVTDPLVCESIRRDDNYHQQMCYSFLAYRTKKHEYCDMLSEQSKRDSCYSAILENEGDIGKCNLESNHDYNDRCKLYVAKNTSNDMVCNDILDITLRNNCYFSLSKNSYRGRDLCGLISDFKMKESCFTSIGYDKRGSGDMLTVDDENIELEYDSSLFQIERIKRFEVNDTIGRYSIKPQTTSAVAAVVKSIDIFISKNTHTGSLDRIEEDQRNLMKHENSTISDVRQVSLGLYDYVKSISIDRVDYETALGKISVNILISLNPPSDYINPSYNFYTNIEGLMGSIKYKF